MPGPFELVIIIIILILIFGGAKRLKNLGSDLGGTIKKETKKLKELNDKKYLEAFSEVEENSTETRERFDRVLKQQRGSEFKEIKNLEIVKKIEKGLSEESRKDFHLVE